MATKNEIKAFQEVIENIVKEKQCSVMDAILLHCEKNDINIVEIKSLISKEIKSKLKKEAIALKMLKIVVK